MPIEPIDLLTVDVNAFAITPHHYAYQGLGLDYAECCGTCDSYSFKQPEICSIKNIKVHPTWRCSDWCWA